MSWVRRFVNVLRPARLGRDLDRELQFHIAERADDLVARGMSPSDAAREARRRFGHLTSLKERTRDTDVVGWLETLAADIRYALRGLRATPAFTLVAVLSLALGLGANTAIFSLANALIFKTLPVRDPEQLVAVTMGKGGDIFTNPLWEEIRDYPGLFDGSFAYADGGFNLADGGEVRRVSGAWVSGEFFSVLGVRAVAGRTLLRSDDARGCAPTAAVSAGFALREHGSLQGAVGKMVSLNGRPFTIVGVVDPDFFGIEVGRSADVYAPICAQDVVYGRNIVNQRGRWFLNVAGRRPTGASMAQMSARLSTASSAIFTATLPGHWSSADQADYLKTKLNAEEAETGFSDARRSYRAALFTMLAVVGVVLLIACANIANLLLARAVSRDREVAIRIALGAARGRVVRQLLTESLVLSFVGAGIGLLFARWASSLLVGFVSSTRRPVWLDLSIDWRVLLFSIAVATATAILFGLVPAWRASHVDPQASLKAGGRGLVSGGPRQRLTKGLVVVQVALSLALVAAAGLLVTSFRRLTSVDPGFRRDGVLVVSLDFANAKYEPAQLEQAKEDALRRARALPGVRLASTALLTPIGRMSWNEFVVVPGIVPRTQADSLVYFNQVTDGYFATLGTPLLAGRDVSAADIAQKRRVAVINETMAHRWFAGRNPLGETFRTTVGDTLSAPIEVIGVVRDAKYQRLDEVTLATAYLPQGQGDDASNSELQLLLRTAGSPTELVPSVRALAADVNPRITFDATTLSAQVNASLARPRLLASLSGFMGVLALVLAVIGLYGMMSYEVTRRRNEIGIRKALGAANPELWRMVVGEALRLIVVGLAVGAAMALASTRLLNAFLFGLTATDPRTFAIAAALLASAALAAACLPAWRAARLDPMEALRED
ncbi:MAG TPA: ABC transporter permease [Gemmatimonadaceae bacterium]|nr:ABC transporter permease [Gemmatimonadaceae bacterium]